MYVISLAQRNQAKAYLGYVMHVFHRPRFDSSVVALTNNLLYTGLIKGCIPFPYMAVASRRRSIVKTLSYRVIVTVILVLHDSSNKPLAVISSSMVNVFFLVFAFASVKTGNYSWKRIDLLRFIVDACFF